ncbi:MAG TPA: hypothetical protein VHL57_08645, partial [Flavobacteriales bacterium]|nr:hypothetical protein [Flavobacteriales bacterium]
MLESVLPLCAIVNTDCPLYHPVLMGHVFYDRNGDGIQTIDEPDAAHARITAEPGGFLTGTDSYGNYSMAVAQGTTTVTVLDDVPFFSGTTPSQRIVQTFSTDTVVAGMDFTIYVSEESIDRRLTLITQAARPGFGRTTTGAYRLNSFFPAPLSVTYDMDPVEVFVECYPMPTTVSGTTITWDLGMSPPNTEGIIRVRTTLPASVPLGTPLTNVVSVLPLDDDDTPANNITIVHEVVVGSCDPNDKQVHPAALTPEEAQAGTPVNYTIRFQNTGTYLAERVLITDTLSEHLQWGTLHFLQASHPCQWFVHDGVLHVLFRDIMLPDSTSDEPGSHGFAQFSIVPSTDLALGESVSNTANIYFDFNEPVITEPCVLTVDESTAVAAIAADGLSLYPDPVSDLLNVRLANASLQRCEVFAGDGRCVMRASGGGLLQLDV